MEIYHTRGTCTRQIIFNIRDNKLHDCRFVNGCSGNAQALITLTDKQDIDWIIEKLSGIRCKQGTSCPDQLAKALVQYKEKQIAKVLKEQQKEAALLTKITNGTPETETAATIN